MAEESTAQHFAKTILPAQGFGTVGVDIFYNKAPDERPTTGPIIVVRNSGGEDPEKNADRTHYTPTIQVLVFGIPEGYDAAWDKIKDVQKYIVETMITLQVGSTIYEGSHQQGDIFPLGEDKNKRPQFSANFILNRREA